MGGQSSYEHSDAAPVGQWGVKYGSSAPRVTPYERDERGGEKQPALYARRYVNGTRRGPYRVRRVPTVRDDSGSMKMEKRQEVETEAKRIWEAVQAGRAPRRSLPKPMSERRGRTARPKLS